MEVTRPDLTPAARTAIVIGVLVLSVVAQGFYVESFSLSFWPGPGHSPTGERGLLLSNVTSGVLLVLAVATAVLARAVALGVVIGVWALLILVNSGLWVVIGFPGLVLVIVLGVVWLVRSRRRADAAPVAR